MGNKARVAIIQYSPQGKEFSARCGRQDINEGDEVEVLTHDDTYLPARVVRIQHEHWRCRDRVVNLASEVTYAIDTDGTFIRTVRPRRPALCLVAPG